MGYRIPELRRGQRDGRLSLSFDGSAELLVASEVDQVRNWFETRTAAGLHEPAMSGAIHSYLRTHPELVAAIRRELAGKDVCCPCAEGAEWCHGDDVIRAAAGEEP